MKRNGVSEGVTDWLPKGAFTEDAIKAALADLVASWSDAWFVRRAAVISTVGIEHDGSLLPAATGSLHVHGVYASGELTKCGKQHLLEAALDIDLAGETPGENDRQVLDAFAAQVAEDLIARLDKAFGGESARSGEAQIGLTLAVAGNDMLTLTFPGHVLVPLLKTQLGGPRPAESSPRSRIDALVPTRLIAEGLLGRAELAVNDLKGLAVGDVLILDRSLHEAVELRLSSGGQHVGCGRLGRSGGHASIQF